MPLKQFLDFLELFLIKNKFEKKQILSFWIGASPKARPYPVRLGPAVTLSGLGVTAARRSRHRRRPLALAACHAWRGRLSL
jgi:hypothetical protein